MVRASSGPKLKRSFKDEEYKPGGGFYDGPAPTPGMHPVHLVSIEEHTSSEGNEGVKWTFDISEGKFSGWRGWVYTNDDTALWKEQEMLVALGVIKPNGSIDMTFDQIVKKAKPCRARIKNEMYDGEARGKIATLIPADEGTPAKGKGRAAEPDEDDAEFEDDAPVSDTDDERDERGEELEKLSLVKLKAEAKKAGLTLADYKGKDEDEIIDLILDAEFGEAEEDDPDEEDEEEDQEFDGEALQEELEALTLAKLKARAKAEFKATLADLKGLDKEDLIEWILEKAEEAFDEAADSDEDEEEPEEEAKPARGRAKAPARSTRSRRGTTDEPPF